VGVGCRARWGCARDVWRPGRWRLCRSSNDVVRRGCGCGLRGGETVCRAPVLRCTSVMLRLCVSACRCVPVPGSVCASRQYVVPVYPSVAGSCQRVNVPSPGVRTAMSRDVTRASRERHSMSRECHRYVTDVSQDVTRVSQDVTVRRTCRLDPAGFDPSTTGATSSHHVDWR